MEGVLFLLIFGLAVWAFILQDKVSYLSQKVNKLAQNLPAAPQQARTPKPQTAEIATAVTETKPSAKENTAEVPVPVAVAAKVTNLPKETPKPQINTVKPENKKTPKEPISFVQLFAWIGGFIFLLGVAFWIKYALENDIISPALRIAIGTLTGIGLWVAGALITKPKLKITSDTLCAVGLSMCYFVWFSAYYFYNMVSQPTAFILLALVAVASFATAVWKNAQYIGLLAQLIGFLTPYLIRTDNPNIWFFLIYVTLINIAAILAALKRDWKQQLFTGLTFTLVCFLAVINKSSALQITCFSGIFSLLYALLSVKCKNKPLLYFTKVFSFIGFCALCGESIPVSAQMLPYISAFAGFFTLFYGILGTRQKDEGLLYSSMGIALVCFCIIAASGKIPYTLGFATGLTLFFGMVTLRFTQLPLKILAMVLSLAGALALSITADLPVNLSFLLGATAFFGYFAVREKDANRFLCVTLYGILPLLIMMVVCLIKNRYSVWMIAGSIVWGLALILTPFIRKNDFLSSTKIWVSACCGGLFSGIIAILISRENLHYTSGLIPLLFACLYGLLFEQIFHWQPVTEPVQRIRATAMSIVTLTFLTWAIGAQFQHEWLTIALALEGAALIWLYRPFRLPALQGVGTGLLAIVAVRLLLNPAIEDYYGQTQLILNWYLYTYLLCACSLFAGAFYWRKTTHNSAANFLRVAGGLLLFALVNIEIANFFADGKGLTFDFCGELAQAATYTIAWTICGAICLFCAVKKNIWLRRSGILLIGLAVLKLFASDIWNLSTALRIVVTIGVAIIMILVSFIYQQFSTQPQATK